MSIEIIIIIISFILSILIIIYIRKANINKDTFNCYKKKQSNITSIKNDDLDIQIIIDANNKFKTKDDEIELL